VLQCLDTDTVAALDTVAVRIFHRAGLVVTVHDRPVSALTRVEHLLVADAERVGNGADLVLHAIFDAAIDEFTPLPDRWEEALDALEARADADHEAATLDDLVALRRDLLVMRRKMLPQQEVVRRILESPDLVGGASMYFRDVLDHMDALSDSAALLVDVCEGETRLQNQRADDRLNNVMKYLALVSTLLLPMTVISGALGMNFVHIPHATSPWGFWQAVALMLASASALVLWFRRKRWM
jgi:magnesium transporter